ncbi:hypothetical protein [Litoreibacter albidus]|uniref:Uncharacterized protein n=1 Tax=Litoreibacter albidus TaxID=670155 RepID=A0A1H2XDX7_9RHOB|nr:hypothetical protein [Litoreibacter albidus]SDW91113.1 hypothetical protein SAMN04488001_1951 [Litoreibacter albidus]
MNYRWLLRASMWVRRPPSERRVKLFVGLIALCIAIALIEHYVGWPEWAKMERAPRVPRF